MKIGVCKLRLVIVYGPTNDKNQEERERFWDTVDEICESVDRNEYLVLLGDMNGRVGGGRLINDRVVGKWGDNDLNEYRECLIEMCVWRGMFIANTWFEHTLIHRYTFCSEDGRYKSMIDYVCVDSRLRSAVKDARVYTGTAVDTDHRMVVCSMVVNGRWKWKARSGRVEKLNIRKLEDEEVRERYRRAVDDKLKLLTEEHKCID